MKKKLCIVVASPYTLEVFLLDQIRALAGIYDVSVALNTDEERIMERLGIDARLIRVRIERKISLVIDFLALLSLYFLFRRERFELVHSVDPKAGLLSMTASRLAGVPVRIHTFTGQVWGTRGGAMRTLLKCADKVTAMASSAILVDSSSQRDFIVKERVLPAEKAFVLGNGSISGVDIRKFQPSAEFRESIRAKHGIPPHSFVILYMARLTRDKGALVMAGAFSRLAAERPSAQLLVVGPDEESLRPRIRDICRLCLDRVHFVDFVSIPEKYMACADVFCLPSYREGFGTAMINAAAVGIPSVASRIYGSTDAVLDGVTGFLFEPGDVSACAGLLVRLFDDPALRIAIGKQARERAARDFPEELLTSSLLAFYRDLLGPPAEKRSAGTRP